MKSFVFNLPLMLVLLIGGVLLAKLRNLGPDFWASYGVTILFIEAAAVLSNEKCLKEISNFQTVILAVIGGGIALCAGLFFAIFFVSVDSYLSLNLSASSIAIISAAVCFMANRWFYHYATSEDEEDSLSEAKAI